MKLFPTEEHDPLDAESLPPTDGTELNYRTRPFLANDEHRLSLLLLFAPASLLVSLAAVFDSVTTWHLILENLALAICGFLAGLLVLKKWMGMPCRRELIATWFVAFGIGAGQTWRLAESIQSWLPMVGIAAAWFASVLIARQVASWILASPRVDQETAARWRVNLPGFLPRGLSLDCPELLTFYVSPFFLAGGWWLADQSAREVLGCPWAWPAAFLCMLHLLQTVWHSAGIVPRPHFERSWWITWRALVIFATYDVHQTPAAGVFRFPTKWLRPVLFRWSLISAVLFILGLAAVSLCPNPTETFRSDGLYVQQMLFNLAITSTSAPLVFLTVLWGTAGGLLTRFYDEHDSESAKQKSKSSEWDNYVERLVNSDDDLEREHFLIGTALVGDYPILLHREILDQHVHLLGDTGSSKTSLGIAPLATQLIAHGDSTVVILDLKGDKALFETCRLEAERTRRLRFRWLNNEVGKNTFSFNPFLQSHNQMLSAEQLGQELLQGLSLDYGLGYGKGYFTAMNETVLTNLLRHCSIRSFRELSAYLEDKSFYSTIGFPQDWDQARHLAALVSRLAAFAALNVVPGMFPDTPEVHSQAVDARNLFEEPQVVYLWLSSPQEPIGAPTMARLFLWALFTAASHSGRGKHRVYIFIDEFQQIISDGMKLVFEQFRDLGGTIIAAHQTAGQLRRQGTDLGETIDSCTAVKQVYRASDVESLKRIEQLGGTFSELTPTWIQPWETGTGDFIDRLNVVHADEGLVRVKKEEKPVMHARRIQEISSSRFGSIVRFTFGSGYTQFGGASVPILSQYPITFEEYQRRRKLAWPNAPGAFIVPQPAPAETKPKTAGKIPGVVQVEDGFVAEFDRRARMASDG